MTEFLWFLGALVVIFGFVVFRGAPYVPSHRRQVERAFDDLYKLGEKDVMVDAGSGDGIVLRLAARRGAGAIGYELNPILVGLSRFLSRRDTKTQVHLADFWRVKLPAETTLVYGFMVERDIEKMARKLQQECERLGRPLHFISYGAMIKDRPTLSDLGAHHLYVFTPLQIGKP
jgi:hypothetical protein